jgi:VanZ family protein
MPRALAPLALMVVIFILSGQSQTGSGFPEWARVVAHFSEYALLAALWAWALAPRIGRKALLAAAAISVLYAVSDEIHQSFVAGRDADPFDVVVDCAGIAAALALLSVRARSRRTARRAP